MTDREGKRIYVDSNVFIYAVEGESDLAQSSQELIDLFRASPGIAVTSELTLAEVLLKASLLQRRIYLDLVLWSGVFELWSVSREILLETIDYRKAAGMPKLPDAIHAVTAIRAGCSMIVSGDLRLKMPTGFSVIRPGSADVEFVRASLI